MEERVHLPLAETAGTHRAFKRTPFLINENPVSPPPTHTRVGS